MPPHAFIFMQDLAITMLVAGFATMLCRQFKQPLVLGYILAGIAIGPHTPPFALISNPATIKTLAELGVIFLMFSLGLEFNLYKLSKVGKTAFIAAVLEIVLMVWIGYEIGTLFGWTHLNAIFLGAILSISSTVIIVKALNELGLKKEKFSQIIFGILIIEDIFAILILALLSSMAITGTLQMKETIINAAKLLSFLILSLIIGILLVPRLLSYIAKFKNDEVLLITVLGICFGFCLLVTKLDYSTALGAFIIGAIIAESHQLIKVERLIGPIKNMFSAIFFVSVGLLFDPRVIVNYFFPIVVITFAVIVGKIISCSFGVLLAGRDGKTSVQVGMGLAQIGEFSFIIAGLGIALNVTSSFLYSIAVCVSIITTLLTPYLIKYSDAFTRYASVLIPRYMTKTIKAYAESVQEKLPLIEERSKLTKEIRLSGVQIIINLFIVMGIFFSASYLAQTWLGRYLIFLTDEALQQTIVWTITLIISLPFLIVSYQEMKALMNALVQMGLSMHPSLEKTIFYITPFVAIVLIMAFVLLLSSDIAPPPNILLRLLIFIAVFLTFSAPWLIRLHAKLQLKLTQSFRKRRKKKKRK